MQEDQRLDGILTTLFGDYKGMKRCYDAWDGEIVLFGMIKVAYYELTQHEKIRWGHYGWPCGPKHAPSRVVNNQLESVVQFIEHEYSASSEGSSESRRPRRPGKRSRKEQPVQVETKVTIQTLDGRTVHLLVDPTDTFQSVRKRIHDDASIPDAEKRKVVDHVKRTIVDRQRSWKVGSFNDCLQHYIADDQYSSIDTVGDGSCLFHSFLNATYFHGNTNGVDQRHLGVWFRQHLYSQFNYYVDKAMRNDIKMERVLTSPKRYGETSDVHFLSLFFRVNILVLKCFPMHVIQYVKYSDDASWIILVNDRVGGTDHYEFARTAETALFPTMPKLRNHPNI